MDGTTGDLAKMATRRVRRPKDKEKLVQRLVDEDKVFETYRDTLAFAAALGYAKSTRTAFELSPGRFEERLLIFEEFANGGLHILNELVARAERQSLDLVLDLIMESEGPR